MKWMQKLAGFFAEKPAPPAGQYVRREPADRYRAPLVGSLTPERLGEIIAAANTGDVQYLQSAAMEIEALNWDVKQAMTVRRNALTGCAWSIVADGEADPAASQLERELRSAGAFGGLDTLGRTVKHLSGAAIAPFAVSEIVWGPGGTVLGFSAIPGDCFTCRDSDNLRLITTGRPDGMELPEHKFLIHRLFDAVDVVRDGSIRTLAWLHVFQNYPLQDLAGFIERYGMPFVIAKVDQSAYDTDRAAIKRLIRNFGPSGGGVFTRAVEVELLQAANNSGEVYFKMLDYCGAAITKVLLGQLASSSASSGLSGGDAQSQVRQDILDADARALEDTINSQLILPWAMWHGVPAERSPRFVIVSGAPEDARSAAEVVKILSEAGFDADPEEVSAKVGLTLTRRAAAAAVNGSGGALVPADALDVENNTKVLAAEDSAPPATDSVLEKWGGEFADEMELLGSDDIAEAEFARHLGRVAARPMLDSEALAAYLQQEIVRAVERGLDNAAQGHAGVSDEES